MSVRSRPPSDDQETSVFDPATSSARSKKSTERGVPSGNPDPPRLPPRPKSPTARRREAIEMATPTEITPAHDRSEPIRVISMKTPADLDADKHGKLAAKQHIVKLRAMSEVSPAPAPAMGRLAPPRDPKEVRSRRMRDYVIWGCVVVIVSCAVMLAIWFIARR